jgi:predicted aldo/keto reductase-like oxidoreductase
MHHVQTQADLDAILADDGALRAAEDARQAGKTRFIGMSNHGHPEMMIQALERYPLDVIMTGTNYYDRFNFPRLEAQLLPMAVERGVGIIGMKGVADGYLWRSAEMALRYAWSLPIGTLALGWNTMEMLEQDLAYAESFTPMSGADGTLVFRCAGAGQLCSPSVRQMHALC